MSSKKIQMYKEEGFSSQQLYWLSKAISENLDESMFSNIDLNHNQMEQIYLGLKAGLEVSIYADPTIPAETMERQRNELMERLGIYDEEIANLNKKKTFIQWIKGQKYILILMAAILIAGINFLVMKIIYDQTMSTIQIPVALNKIDPYTKITEQMIGYLDVPKSTILDNYYSDINQIIGSYIKPEASIQKHSFFYKDAILKTQEEIGYSAGTLLPGEYAYTIKIDIKYSNLNELQIGQRVDIGYIGYQTVDNKTLQAFGVVTENTRVLNINQTTENDIEQKYITLALTDEELDYVIRAEMLGTIFPITSYKSQAVSDMKSEYFDMYKTRSSIDNLTFKNIKVEE